MIGVVRRAVAVLLLVSGAVLGVPVASPAGAQETTATTATTEVERSAAREQGALPPEALLAAVRLGEATERLAKVEVELAEVQRSEDGLRAELGVVEQHLAENRTRAEELEERLRARAAAVYTRGGSGPLAPLTIASRQDLQSGRSYTAAVNSVDGNLVDELAALRAELERDRDRKVAAIDELQRARERLVAARAEIDALRVQEQMLIDQWGAVSIMGKARLDADQIAAWYDSTGIRPNLPPGVTIADLARLFVAEGELAGVKGDIAFAQSIIETGSFTEYKGYNFSGIGVCDSCTGGYLFDAARDGIRAQMQLLRSYADPGSRAADLPVPLSPVLYGTDPVESARRFDTFFLKGAAPVWNEMGGGNWATDPYYAGKVLRVYARMLAHSQGR